MRISVVIPVFGDRKMLRDRLPRGFHEVIVVDASREDPVRQEDLPAGSVLIRAEAPHRAAQMNAGAERASGEGILFLHADTVLPPGAAEAIAAALADESVAGGGFERIFDHPSWMLKATCRLAALRCRRTGWFLGDQAIFVRRGVFEHLGGYSQMGLFEDLDLCRRLKRVGRLRCLAPGVVSSGRRFANGTIGRLLGDLWLVVRYFVSGGRSFHDIS